MGTPTASNRLLIFDMLKPRGVNISIYQIKSNTSHDTGLSWWIPMAYPYSVAWLVVSVVSWNDDLSGVSFSGAQPPSGFKLSGNLTCQWLFDEIFPQTKKPPLAAASVISRHQPRHVNDFSERSSGNGFPTSQLADSQVLSVLEEALWPLEHAELRHRCGWNTHGTSQIFVQNVVPFTKIREITKRNEKIT